MTATTLAPELVRPAADEVQITVLGQQEGESIVVHLGDDRWVVVDSFRGRWPGEEGTCVAPLRCLEALDVNVDRVSAIVLTHLHEDHCLGIETVVEACRPAWFLMPAAVADERWGEVISAMQNEAPATGRKRMNAIAGAFRIARDQGRIGLLGSRSLVPGVEEELQALAPTPAAMQTSREAFQQLDPAGARRLLHENATSVVLWLEVGAARALLCGDMDKHGRMGWHAVLADHEGRDLGGATFVKVAHHGSQGSHEPGVFERWTDDPIGVIAPNRFRNNNLPNAAHLSGLQAATRELWLAGEPEPRTAAGSEAVDAVDEIRWVSATCSRDGGRFEMRPQPADEQRL